jgi:hypothetical protein
MSMQNASSDLLYPILVHDYQSFWVNSSSFVEADHCIRQWVSFDTEYVRAGVMRGETFSIKSFSWDEWGKEIPVESNATMITYNRTVPRTSLQCNVFNLPLIEWGLEMFKLLVNEVFGQSKRATLVAEKVVPSSCG